MKKKPKNRRIDPHRKWYRNPVQKVKQSKKMYDRKKNKSLGDDE